MRLRPYIASKDFEIIKTWISDERSQALWCANWFQFPLEKENFETVLKDVAERFGDTPFVATSEDGILIGFFSYSLNLDINEGMLKYVIINPEYRGKGFGQEMIRLVVKYAFEITNAQSVQLNVFPENARAKKCYEAVGFQERKIDLNSFSFKEESWGRCNMVIRRES